MRGSYENHAQMFMRLGWASLGPIAFCKDVFSHRAAYRFKTLSDGRRQILNFLLAGDFIGVQQKMGDQAAHGVVTLTTARLCVFDRDALWDLHHNQPTMGFNVTWLTAHEKSLVDDNLLSIGRRSAEERLHLMDPAALARLAGLYGDGRPPQRPLV